MSETPRPSPWRVLLPGIGAWRRGDRVTAALSMAAFLWSVGVLLAGADRGRRAMSAAARWLAAVLAGTSGAPFRAAADPWVLGGTLLAVGVIAGTLGQAWRLERVGAAAERRETPARLAWRHLTRNRAAVGGLGVMLILYLVTATSALIVPWDPLLSLDSAHNKLKPPLTAFTATLPSGEVHGRFWLGSDDLGRDVLSRLLVGARISLTIGLVSAGISMTLGTVVGATAGFLAGWVDQALMRVADLLISFPRLVLLLFLTALYSNPSIYMVITVIGLTSWMGIARLVRGQILSLKNQDFVQAARALGLSTPRILFRHLIPNAIAPVIVHASLGVGAAILIDASLSFLGLGVPPPTPTWGAMIADGRNNLLVAWWLTTLPGLAIVVAVVSFNLVGDGLRDALDPRQRT